MSVTAICQVSTLGGSLSAGAAWMPEVHRVGPERDEVLVLVPLVDDWQPECFVERPFGVDIAHVQDRRQPGEQPRFLLAHDGMLARLQRPAVA